MELKVRRANSHDVLTVSEVLESAYRYNGLYGADTKMYKNLELESAHRIETACVYVAENIQGRVIATRTLSFKGMGYRDVAEEYEVEGRRLAVHPDFRGHGVTGVFWRELLPEMIEKGATQMVVSTGSTWATNKVFPKSGLILRPERQWFSEKLGQTMNVYTKTILSELSKVA